MMLGEMVNLQKLNLTKIQPINKMNKKLWLMFFLTSWLFDNFSLYPP
jgi:hypothetical protein